MQIQGLKNLFNAQPPPPCPILNPSDTLNKADFLSFLAENVLFLIRANDAPKALKFQPEKNKDQLKY